MKKHYRHENDCLNCGTILEGKFCHHCGQENLQIKENFGHLMNHAISDYFHFDHQFFHTLKPLLFKPGKLTNEYMAGRRVQYLHPIKMYIFISLVFFVLFFKKNAHEGEKTEVKHKKVTKEQIDSAKRVIENAPILGSATKEIITKRLDEGERRDSIKKAKHKNNIEDEDVDDGFVKADFSDVVETDKYPNYEAYLAAQKKLPENKQDGFIKNLIVRKKFDYKKKGGDPKEAIEEEVKHNVPKMMFLLLPIFALILSIAFRKNRKYYVEHLIFSFHLHCFVFLFLSVSMLLQWIIPGKAFHDLLDLAVMICLVIYVYKALRAVYHRGRGRTISKMFGMSFMYLMVFGICYSFVYFISALTAA
ncbi:DUF3667 domain-containing protein [Mucilaginibacter sp. RS28]|uniref:DUF3667 domain-containing protein n=1 Tax=Mucilaginibacter straminoryzae TaxID=2932774 RepID=A0A9X1X533_9SPHI|nr:DUF3667 domain-containing protein [Mucilaginibacter straminoryzae]MCJ8211242.1 DUF3667 domain-containing protein [Mucilaginibacter straminoryzae]